MKSGGFLAQGEERCLEDRIGYQLRSIFADHHAGVVALFSNSTTAATRPGRPCPEPDQAGYRPAHVRSGGSPIHSATGSVARRGSYRPRRLLPATRAHLQGDIQCQPGLVVARPGTHCVVSRDLRDDAGAAVRDDCPQAQSAESSLSASDRGCSSSIKRERRRLESLSKISKPGPRSPLQNVQKTFGQATLFSN